MKWIAAASLLIAIAAGVLAFQRDRAANAAAEQVASLKAQTQKAQADLNASVAERDALRKETAELKTREQELRSAAELAGRFLEAEKAVSARLREDLVMVSARLAAAGSRQQQRGADVLQPGLPSIARPPPFVVRAAPGGPTAAGAGAPAR